MKRISILVVVSLVTLLPATPTFAEKVCLKSTIKNGAVRLTKRQISSGSCARGFVEIVDTSELTGPQGPSGPSGADGTAGNSGPTGATGPSGATGPDGTTGPTGPQGSSGQLAVYGSGDDGALTVSGSSAYSTNHAQYTSFTVNSGVTLTVPSGTTIRATGACTIDGTIVVSAAAQGGKVVDADSVANLASSSSANPGIGANAAGNSGSQIGTGVNVLRGGVGALALSSTALGNILNPGVFGGGGGGGSYLTNGGAGGGVFRLLCSGAITVSGTGIISANGSAGTSGAGGGGGGVIILASGTSITNSGTINANGGNGGPRVPSYQAPGGGGGGGIVHMLSPSNTTGTVNRNGGAAGTGSGDLTVSAQFLSGAGGGASGGAGGNGCTVASNDGNITGDPATAGSAGPAVFAVTTSSPEVYLAF